MGEQLPGVASRSKKIGWLALLSGALGIVTMLALVLFFIGLFQDVRALASFGAVNDVLNALTAILVALLASMLQAGRDRAAPHVHPLLTMGVWVGAIAVGLGTWLIQSGAGGLELSSYYFFFGNGLIGLWAWILNRAASRFGVWRPALTRLGRLAGALMTVGLLSLGGIVLGLDGDGYSPLILLSGISYLGTGILFPVWCLRLGSWLLSAPGKRAAAIMER